MLTTTRLVKSEDLNHHGTLFAGRLTEWFVESCFGAAALAVGNPNSIVCLKIHGLAFTKPCSKGDLVTLDAQVVAIGKTSIIVYCKVSSAISHLQFVDGFVTFVNVDENGKKQLHHLTLSLDSQELIALNKQASSLI